jgi:hypothetical protein
MSVKTCFRIASINGKRGNPRNIACSILPLGEDKRWFAASAKGTACSVKVALKCFLEAGSESFDEFWLYSLGVDEARHGYWAN